MKRVLVVFIIMMVISGCSINKIAIRKTAELIDTGMSAVYEETDLKLAETAIASNLKLMEVLLKNDPDNKKIKILLSQGYGAYSLAFIEDSDPERAKYFYLKSRDYAIDVLMTHPEFKNGIPRSLEDLKVSLQKCDKNWVEPLFWAATNWGNWVMLSLDNNRALFALPKVEAMMERVIELDETFYFATAHLFFGSVHAAKPVMLGGKPELSKEHFDRALVLTNKRFLMANIYYARFYAVQVQDETLFKKLLNEVLEADLNILPEFKLVNQVAKEKARLWLKKSNDLF